MATKFTVKHKRSSVVNTSGSGTNQVKTPKAPTTAQCEVGEITLNNADGYETLFIQNSNGAIVPTKLGPLDTELNEESKMGVENQAVSKHITNIRKQLNNIAHTLTVYGMGRVNGDPDPDGAIFFGKPENFHREFKDVIRTGLFKKDGTLYKSCANCRIDEAVDGTPLAIDGADGDVMIYTTQPVYVLKFTDMVDGEELNLFAISLNPFTIYGRDAKKLEPFAIDPHYPTFGKLDKTNTSKLADFEDEDAESCYHSIYNPNIVGDATVGVSIFKNPWRTGGGGYPVGSQSYVTSAYRAQLKNRWPNTAGYEDKNHDQNYKGPWMGFYYEFYEFWLMMMFVELQSLNHTPLNLFGTGTTASEPANDPKYFGDLEATANSGWMAVKKLDDSFSKTANNINGSKPVETGSSYSGYQMMCNSYQYTECLEPNRILNEIAKAGLVNRIWSAVDGQDDQNKGIMFTHKGADEISHWTDVNKGDMVVSDVTVDMFADGDNDKIVPDKKYYQVRNVPGCAGMADGAMTAVVNIYVKKVLDDGTGATSAAHNTMNDYVIFKLSYPVYRGAVIFNNNFKQLYGCIHCFDNDRGTVAASFKYALSPDDLPEAINNSGAGYGSGTHGQELHYEKGLKGSVPTLQVSAWAAKSNYSASIFCYTANQGNFRTHECAYTWRPGMPTENVKTLYAAVVGCYSAGGIASARTVAGFRTVGYGDAYYVGGLSLPNYVQ